MDNQTTNQYASRIPDLENHIYATLINHVGFDENISRKELHSAIRHMELPSIADMSDDRLDRMIRFSINEMRKDGYPICSCGGRHGGYWIAKDREELQKYIDTELIARIRDQALQLKALRRTRLVINSDHDHVWQPNLLF